MRQVFNWFIETKRNTNSKIKTKTKPNPKRKSQVTTILRLTQINIQLKHIPTFRVHDLIRFFFHLFFFLLCFKCIAITNLLRTPRIVWYIFAYYIYRWMCEPAYNFAYLSMGYRGFIIWEMLVLMRLIYMLFYSIGFVIYEYSIFSSSVFTNLNWIKTLS